MALEQESPSRNPRSNNLISSENDEGEAATIVNLCEEIWVSIISFISSPLASSTYKVITELQRNNTPIQTNNTPIDEEQWCEKPLRCTCRTLNRVLKSERYYRAKVTETYFPLDEVCRGWDSTADDGPAVRTRFPKDWPSVERSGGWRVLHGILFRYARLEGWYVIGDRALPWGLLVLCRFIGGSFCGDIVRAVPVTSQATDDDAAASSDKLYESLSERLIEISFLEGGSSLCRVLGNIVSSLRVVVPSFGAEANTAPKYPLTMMQNRLRLELLWRTESTPLHTETDLGDLRYFPTLPAEHLIDLITATTSSKCNTTLPVQDRKLSLQYLGGRPQGRPLSIHPTLWQQRLPYQRERTIFQNNPTTPSMKPGLYVGSYGDHYGSFQHEILHIRYIRVERNDSAAKSLSDAFGGRIPDKLDVSGKGWDSGVLLSAQKATGDSNVPSGEVSWCVTIPSQHGSGGAGDDNVPPQRKKPDPQRVVTDKYGKRYRVVRWWDGWGTLAYPDFKSPSWDDGWLLQLQNYDGDDDGDKFAFCWSRFASQGLIVLHTLPHPQGSSFLWSSTTGTA